MTIRRALPTDTPLLSAYDHHISKQELEISIKLHRVYIAEDNGTLIGWLRYNMFWDNTPFMNMLYFLEEYRGKGYGKRLVEFWESEMSQAGYKTVMTSTASDEYAQHFYVKLGYKSIGGFTLHDDPFELIFFKDI